MIADSENVLYNNPVNIKCTYAEAEVSCGLSEEGLVVLARHLRGGFGAFDPFKSLDRWGMLGNTRSTGGGGGHELISPPACKCSTSYQTICPAARICPGTETNVLKPLELI